MLLFAMWREHCSVDNCCSVASSFVLFPYFISIQVFLQSPLSEMFTTVNSETRVSFLRKILKVDGLMHEKFVLTGNTFPMHFPAEDERIFLC